MHLKNQPFHPRKIRIQETPEQSLDELKDRTIIALNKLGAQRFSDEIGGYSLDNWAKGVNMLLDDFEEKMGKERLPSDYFAKRRELNEILSRPVSTPEADRDISETRKKMTDVRGKIDEEKDRLASKIAGLRDERAGCSADLAREQERVSNLAAERSSGSFFRRLIGRNPARSQGFKSRVGELEARLGALDREMLEQQKIMKSNERRAPESPLAEDWKTLESLQARLESLEASKSETVQLVKTREEFAASMAETISKISS